MPGTRAGRVSLAGAELKLAGSLAAAGSASPTAAKAVTAAVLAARRGDGGRERANAGLGLELEGGRSGDARQRPGMLLAGEHIGRGVDRAGRSRRDRQAAARCGAPAGARCPRCAGRARWHRPVWRTDQTGLGAAPGGVTNTGRLSRSAKRTPVPAALAARHLGDQQPVGTLALAGDGAAQGHADDLACRCPRARTPAARRAGRASAPDPPRPGCAARRRSGPGP